MQKSLISMAVLLTFSNLATSQEVNSIINTNQSFDLDTTINVSAVGEGTDRYAGIGLNDTAGNHQMNVTSKGGITIEGDQSKLTNPGRLYGVVAGHLGVTGNKLVVDSKGDVVVDLKSDEIDTRGIRANGGAIDVTAQKISVSVESKTNQAIGVEAWYGTSLTMTADQIEVTSKSETGPRVYGVQAQSEKEQASASKIEFNADNIKVKAEASDVSELVRGIYAHKASVDFNGLAEITVKGGNSANIRGVSLESDDGDNAATIVNFNDAAFMNVTSNASALGVYSSGNPSQLTFAKNTKIDVTSTSGHADGIQVQYSGAVKADGNVGITVKAGETANGIINTNSAPKYGDGTFGRLIIDGATTITAEGKSAYGIRNHIRQDFDQKNNPYIQLNGATTISVTATGEDGTAVGIDANHKAPILVTDSTITATSAKGESFGVRADTDGELTLNGQSTVVAKGDKSVGMSVKTGANVKVIGEATVIGKNAFVGDATSVVNVEGANDRAGGLVLNGNVDNAGVINLTNSSLEVLGTTTQAKLGTIQTQGSDNSQVAVCGGDVLIDSFKGESKSLVLKDLKKTGKVQVAEKEGNLTVVAAGESNDQYNNVNETLDALLSKVDIEQNDPKAEDTVYIEDGKINDSLTATFNKDGTVSDVVISKNTTLDAYSSVATLSAFQWRHEINSVNKRMGELRLSPNGVGAWARLYGSEQEYGAQNVTAKNHSVQVGLDTDVGNGWKGGAAFNYTDGQSTYDAGNGDNKAYGLTAYGTWMADNGQYVDLTAKYSRLDNDFTVNKMVGDYSNNAYSVSAEYGWHFKMADVAFVEPQVEVMYGKVMGDNFKANNGVTIEQEDFESLITRAGVRSGFYFPENKGVIYARASVLHDFKGEMESTARFEKAVNSVKDDIGGTWYEIGLGANFNMSPTSYIYVDLERTNGGAVFENWRYNLGFRKVF